MTFTESVLEDEGMHVLEWRGGEYRPLAEIIAENVHYISNVMQWEHFPE